MEVHGIKKKGGGVLLHNLVIMKGLCVVVVLYPETVTYTRNFKSHSYDFVSRNWDFIACCCTF